MAASQPATSDRIVPILPHKLQVPLYMGCYPSDWDQFVTLDYLPAIGFPMIGYYETPLSASFSGVTSS